MNADDDAEATVIRARAVSVESKRPVVDAEDTIIRLIEPPVPTRSARTSPSRPALFDESDDHLASFVAAPSWAVRVRGTDAIVPLDRPVIVGRNPGVPRPGDGLPARRVIVPAECQDVSARHARFELVGETLTVTDLGSTNGVVVHWSRGGTHRLRPRESCSVEPDSLIELGALLQIEFVAVA